VKLFDPIDVKRVFKEICSNTLRKLIVKVCHLTYLDFNCSNK
jgi:hypothetical protein